MVEYLKTKADFDKAVEDSAEKLVVIDFTASWCPPCKMIAPKYEEMAKENPEATLYKIDVDENKEGAQAAGIQAMPTFKFYKGGKEVDMQRGANEAAVREKIAQHK